MTRAQYLASAHQLCMLVNARRAQRRREPLREQHIMRVVRLAIGPAPALVYPPYHHRRPRKKAHWRADDG